ncbi:hypothetical protein TrVE_jg2824 [Triparma verrucosa]|uniref:Uncharacterized protein n=1 Tax=Triparma verrucosa TaxID=1606542 RepID=A0A9W7BKC0_9STRA|nr:hypothetical protein TrVE_jg2824 [Triparma verrucosa]
MLLTLVASTSALAGFGAGGASKKATLKPKSQWDKYLKLRGKVKKEGRVAGVAFAEVAVRFEGEDWSPVGFVGADGVSVEAAATRQKRLIAEHAQRIYPAMRATGETSALQWGLKSITAFVDNKPEATSDEFVALSKIDEDVSEKKVGFEGIPDPTTGYYCMYSSGKLMGEAGRSDAEMGITGGKKSGEKRTGL